MNNFPRYPVAERKRTKGADVWSMPSPLSEARSLFEMFRRGMHADAIRHLVRISEKERTELQEFARENPALATRIEACISYRDEVEAIFERLLKRAKEKAA